MLKKLSEFLSNELNEFNEGLKKSLTTSVSDYEGVLDYIFSSKGKQIRPIIGILTANMLGGFNEKQNTFLQAIELIHNATLFHDDVIDEAEIRRNNVTLNEKFCNKIAVLSGDYFLCAAIKNIYSLCNNEINGLVANFMKKICEGEIEQNLTLNKIPSLEDYLKKTKNKTALLFSMTTYGVSLLSENNEYYSDLKDFGENLGMIFQIKDDLKNFLEYENKPVLNDLKSGVITAPIIFLAQENSKINMLLENSQYDEILSLLKKSNAIEKTKNLINEYYRKAVQNLSNLPQNKYKQFLLELLAELGK